MNCSHLRPTQTNSGQCSESCFRPNDVIVDGVHDATAAVDDDHDVDDADDDLLPVARKKPPL
jgi:hypothetical protein